MLGFIRQKIKSFCRRVGLWGVEEKVLVRPYQVANGDTLAGKNVLITGGTSGIGFAIAKKCLNEGANVVITGRNAEKMKSVLSEDKSGRLSGLIWDISIVNDATERIAEVEKLFNGEIDVLVNNAGISSRERPGAITEDAWEKILRINLTAPVFITQAMAKSWILNCKEGVVLNISSMAGLQPSFDAYSVAKCGLNSMTKGMARVWAAKGIRINALAVGLTIGTELNATQRAHKPDGDLKCTGIPIGRFAIPDEIAETAAYLISDRSAYMTGAVVECDGAGSIAFGS